MAGRQTNMYLASSKKENLNKTALIQKEKILSQLGFKKIS